MRPTSTATPTATELPTATSTPEATSTTAPRWLLAPVLQSPESGTRFAGWNAEVILRWAEVGWLAPDEYYVVRVPYDDVGGVAEFWRKETSLRVPANFSLAEVGFADRHYNWTVQVMHCTGNCDRALDDDVTKRGAAAGGVSAQGLFYWDPDTGGEKPAATPTWTPKS